MKQFISTLLLIGCLVACDPCTGTEAIEAPQETTKSNGLAINAGRYENHVIVYTFDPTDQFVFSVYPENKMKDDKTSIILFPPKEQVGKKKFVNQFKFVAIHRPKPELENKLAITFSCSPYSPYKNYNKIRFQYFQDAEELNHYINEPDEIVIGVYSKKYTKENISFKYEIRREFFRKPGETIVNLNEVNLNEVNLNE